MKRLAFLAVTTLTLALTSPTAAPPDHRQNNPTIRLAIGSEPIPEPLPIPPVRMPQDQAPVRLAIGSEPIPEPLPIPPNHFSALAV